MVQALISAIAIGALLIGGLIFARFFRQRLGVETEVVALIYGLTTTLGIIVIVLVAWLAAGR
jgi:hypothetical protein